MNYKEIVSDLYMIKLDSLKKVSDGYQNSVLATDHLIFRITNTNRRTQAELQSELDLITHLAMANLPVSQPIPSPNGNLVEEIDGHFVTAFQRAAGQPVDLTNKTVWNADLFFKWGQIIGKMHQTTNVCNYFNRPKWTPEDPDLLKLLPRIQSDKIRHRYQEQLEKLKRFQPSPNLFGLIHNDFHQGNFFVHNGSLTVFDFDDCAYHWKAYDLAVSCYHAYWQASSFTPEDTNFTKTFWTNFLNGYQKEHPAPKEMLEQIPIFLKIREIFLYTLFLEKWDLHNLEDWQSYTLEDLKERISFDKLHDFHIEW